MSEGFPQVALRSIACPVSRPIPVLSGASYRTFGVKWWGEGAYERDTIDGSATAARTLFLIHEGDLVINKIWVRHGSVAIAPKAVHGCAASNEFPTFELDRTRVEPNWLHWLTKTRHFWDKCAHLSFGTSGKNRIKPDQFLTVELPLPSLAEQRRIVARIEEVAGKIEAARVLRRKVDGEVTALRQTVMQPIFDPERTQYISLPLGDVCETASGGTPSRDRADFYTGSISWIKSGELEGDIILKAEESISRDAVRSSSAKVFPKGTLLIALYGATTGKTGVLGIEAATNQAVCALFPDARLDQDYLWWFLRYMRPSFMKLSFGGAQPNISQKLLRGTPILVPPLPEQRRIVAHLDALQVKVDALKRLQAETAAELEALLPSVLDRAFSGGL